MSQSEIPIEQLKVILKSANEETLAQFMHRYALCVGADFFISIMIAPGQRAEFLAAIAKSYPDDWKKTLELLKAG